RPGQAHCRGGKRCCHRHAGGCRGGSTRALFGPPPLCYRSRCFICRFASVSSWYTGSPRVRPSCCCSTSTRPARAPGAGSTACALHGQGATVAISGTVRDALDQLAGELKDRVLVLPCNLAVRDEVEALVPKAEEAMGKLDILVANAGITKDNLLVQLRDEDW